MENSTGGVADYDVLSAEVKFKSRKITNSILEIAAIFEDSFGDNRINVSAIISGAVIALFHILKVNSDSSEDLNVKLDLLIEQCQDAKKRLWEADGLYS